MSHNARNEAGGKPTENNGVSPCFPFLNPNTNHVTQSSQMRRNGNSINFYFYGQENKVNINIHSGVPNFYGIPQAADQNTFQPFAQGQDQTMTNERMSDQSLEEVRPDFRAAESLLLWPSSSRAVSQAPVLNDYPTAIGGQQLLATASQPNAFVIPSSSEAAGVVRSAPGTFPGVSTSTSTRSVNRVRGIRRVSGKEDLAASGNTTDLNLDASRPTTRSSSRMQSN